MVQKLTHSFEVSETPEDWAESDQSKPGSLQRKQLLAVPDQWVRQRVQSMDAVVTFRTNDHPWRARVYSAPPHTAVRYTALRYGRALRKITDEFDHLLDKRMNRMWNGRLASQIQQFPTFLSFLWGYKKSDCRDEAKAVQTPTSQVSPNTANIKLLQLPFYKALSNKYIDDPKRTK